MLKDLLKASLPAILAGALGLPAHADIFTWVDASGSLNVSNLAPPEGVRVTNVVHASAPSSSSRESAREALREAEVQVLAEQVRQLQDQVDQTRRQVPVQFGYQSAPPPAPVPYESDWVPPVQYAYDAAPPPNAGCDATWTNCGSWWGPGIYPASVVVLRAPKYRRMYPMHMGHHVAAPPPVHALRGSRMR